MKQRMLATLLVLSLLLSGCGSSQPKSTDKSDKSGSESEGFSIGGGGGLSIEDHGFTEDKDGNELAPPPTAEEYGEMLDAKLAGMTPDEQADLFLGYADDMLQCQIDGMTGEDMLIAAGVIAEKYPHPLVLNNYATLCMSFGRDTLAIEILRKAEKSQPDDPAILTNIANAFLDTGDLTGAMNYAAKALRVDPEYGLAYQVMTTVHLANGDELLAAETMLKEGKYCWNEITTHHFQSCYLAIEKLDPDNPNDEHPFNENNLRLLFELARQGVSQNQIDATMDTPQSQKELPFPFPDDLNFYQYTPLVDGQSELYVKCYAEYDKLQQESRKLTREYEDELYTATRSEKVIRDLRQNWVLELLEQYYDFQLRRAWLKIDQKQLDALDQQDEDFLSNVMLPRMEQIVKMGGTPAALAATASLMKQRFSVFVNTWGKYPKIYKEHYEKEVRPLLEEYWLRMDAALKYVQNKDLQDEFIWRRKNTTTDRSTFDAVNALSGVHVSMYLLNQGLEELGVAVAAAAPAASIKTIQMPQTEPVILQPFVEPNPPSRNISANIGFFGYGIGGSSDGYDYTITLDTPMRKKEWTRNMQSGQLTVVTAEAVGATIPKSAGALLYHFGRAANYIIGAPTKAGTYTTFDRNGNITDHGKYQQTTRSLGAAGDFSGAGSTETRRSLHYTGVGAKVKTATQFNFMNFGVQ